MYIEPQAFRCPQLYLRNARQVREPMSAVDSVPARRYLATGSGSSSITFEQAGPRFPARAV